MPTATYSPIATQTLSSTSSLVTFSSIPSTYTDLKIVIQITSSSTYLNTNLFFNTDNGLSGTSYSYAFLYGNGSAASTGANINQSYITIGSISNSTSTTIPNICIVDIFNYANTSTYKSVLALNALDKNGSGDSSEFSGLWRSTAAIDTVKIAPAASTFAAGSKFTLWGI
jgi:hypothetical protein